MLSYALSLSKHLLRAVQTARFICKPPARPVAVILRANMATIVKARRDPNTLSNYNYWNTKHTTATFDILFDQKKLDGNVTHKIEAITDNETGEIILDSKFVEVKDVTVDGSKVQWELGEYEKPYGAPLKIQLGSTARKGQIVEVSIDCFTQDEQDKAKAIQWLEKEQTSNKKHPYMFSQCQAILARTVFPCQDTPDVKSTFDYNIKSNLVVITSGLPLEGNPTQPSLNGERQLYRFEQKIPIPSYLFSIASGDIARAPIGPRSWVATGPDELKRCQDEFKHDTNEFIKIAEKLVYEYQWGEYNVLVLPPSFPFGGMENPVYTFATPTIVSGDRANVDVIAHELAHSWSGNLVSNASWEHFWLNEGWTVYLERRIQAALHGEDPRGDNAHRDFSAMIGWATLTRDIEKVGREHNFTRLIPDLVKLDPDDAFSTIPYEKGFTFLYHIEKLIGVDNFDRFIRHYFVTWCKKSLDSYEFKETLLGFFADDKVISAKLDGIAWETWFKAPGYPPKPRFNDALARASIELAEKWTRDPSFEPHRDDIKGLEPNQIVVFLDEILQAEKALPAAQAQKMGPVYEIIDSGNVEVSSRYYQVAMKAEDQTIKQRVRKMLGEVGRGKYVEPLYISLIRLDREYALETFKMHERFYHPITRANVKEIFDKSK